MVLCALWYAAAWRRVTVKSAAGESVLAYAMSGTAVAGENHIQELKTRFPQVLWTLLQDKSRISTS